MKYLPVAFSIFCISAQDQKPFRKKRKQALEHNGKYELVKQGDRKQADNSSFHIGTVITKRNVT